MNLDLHQHPLVLLIRKVLDEITPSFQTSFYDQQDLIKEIHQKLLALMDEVDPLMQAYLLSGCVLIPELSQQTLNEFLQQQALPPSVFMGPCPSNFDCVLVPLPLNYEVPGSGYVLCFSNGLLNEEIYYLISHALGHLAAGHLRKGDIYSHFDLISSLRAPAGPPRYWDQAVQQILPSYYQSLPSGLLSSWKGQEPNEWKLAGVAEAYERLLKHQVDPLPLFLREILRHYDTQVLHVDFDIERDAELFPHQKVGAVELAVRLQKLGVAILADSVGLGKTRTTATLIKLLRQHGLIYHAAILTPSKLEHNWRYELLKLQLTIGQPGDMNVDVVIVNKDKFKRLDPIEARRQVEYCDLLVIEEAHQDMRNMGNKFHRNIREVSLERYGLLITATPWNNRRGDIFSMLQPFASNTRGKERPVQAFNCFSKAMKFGLREFEESDEIFEQVYQLTALQRTRRMLRESGDQSVFYAPRRPHLLEVPYQPEQRQAFASLLQKIEQLRLPHFDPLRYLSPEKESLNRLSGIHRFVLLKRAESSMYAFSQSLQSLEDKSRILQETLQRVNDSDAAVAAWLRRRYSLEEREEGFVGEELEGMTDFSPRIRMRQARLSHLIESSQRAGKLRSLRHSLLADCALDQDILAELLRNFQPLFKSDPKLDVICQQVLNALSNGLKVLCISQFSDTALAVYRHLLRYPLIHQYGIGLVTGGSAENNDSIQINGKPASREQVLRRFAPHSWSSSAEKVKKRTREINMAFPDSIGVVVGSDTLSVGQNLQDARVLINLDLCWNPMLHEQRIGRIDRPRHKNDSAPLDIFYLLNLDLIESELQLHTKIEKRLAATYRDTEFDDEILPGYFEMIERFRAMRQKQEVVQSYTDEVNLLLEDISERSARPAEVIPFSNEDELRALLLLRDHAAPVQESLHRDIVQLINIGRIPLVDLYGLPASSISDAALIAEVAFQPVNNKKLPVGDPWYRRFYLKFFSSNQETGDITVENDSLASLVDGLLAENATISLHREHISYLHSLLLKLESVVEQEQEASKRVYERARRHRSMSTIKRKDEPVLLLGPDTVVDSIDARLSHVRLLI